MNQFRSTAWHAKESLFLTQCSSLYGYPWWNLDDPNIDKLCTAWRVCSRKILDLVFDSRADLLHHIMNILPNQANMMYRMLSFHKPGN